MSSPTPEAPSSDRSSGVPGTYCFRVTAEAEISVLSRVLELFVIRDALPIRVSSEVIEGSDPVQEIEIDVGGLEDHMAQHLSIRIEQFMSVQTVTMHRRLPVAAAA
jgi:hypothetical protein